MISQFINLHCFTSRCTKDACLWVSFNAVYTILFFALHNFGLVECPFSHSWNAFENGRLAWEGREKTFSLQLLTKSCFGRRTVFGYARSLWFVCGSCLNFITYKMLNHVKKTASSFLFRYIFIFIVIANNIRIIEWRGGTTLALTKRMEQLRIIIYSLK